MSECKEKQVKSFSERDNSERSPWSQQGRLPSHHTTVSAGGHDETVDDDVSIVEE